VVANVLKKYNYGLLQCVIRGTTKQNWYFWDQKTKLWNSHESFVLNSCIELICEIVEYGSRKDWLSKRWVDAIRVRVESTTFMRLVLKQCNIKASNEFINGLDACIDFVALPGGKKFVLMTGAIEDRQPSDYCTKAFELEYVQRLSDYPASGNCFKRFLQSLFEDEEEYQFMRLVLGYVFSHGNPDQVVFALQHSSGANGKTMLKDVLSTAFGSWVKELSRNVVLEGQGNLNAEFNKVDGCRAAFVEEATRAAPDGTVIRGASTLDINPLLKLSGTKYLQERDICQKGTEVARKRVTCTPFLLMNSNSFATFNVPFWQRRFLLIPLQFRFVPPGSPLLEEDPFAREADRTLLEHLDRSPHHTFTFVLNCMHFYHQRGKPELKTILPPRLRNVRIPIQGGPAPPAVAAPPLVPVPSVSPVSDDLASIPSLDVWNRFVAQQCEVGPGLHMSRKTLVVALQKIDSRFRVDSVQQRIEDDVRIQGYYAKVWHPRPPFVKRLHIVCGIRLVNHHPSYVLTIASQQYVRTRFAPPLKRRRLNCNKIINLIDIETSNSDTAEQN